MAVADVLDDALVDVVAVELLDEEDDDDDDEEDDDDDEEDFSFGISARAGRRAKSKGEYAQYLCLSAVTIWTSPNASLLHIFQICLSKCASSSGLGLNV